MACPALVKCAADNDTVKLVKVCKPFIIFVTKTILPITWRSKVLSQVTLAHRHSDHLSRPQCHLWQTFLEMRVNPRRKQPYRLARKSLLERSTAQFGCSLTRILSKIDFQVMIPVVVSNSLTLVSRLLPLGSPDYKIAVPQEGKVYCPG